MMDRLREFNTEAINQPYNHSISIIQSSGMGKSRLMDTVAELRFCFPINIREPLAPGVSGKALTQSLDRNHSDPSSSAYPPPDAAVYSYFECSIKYSSDGERDI